MDWNIDADPIQNLYLSKDTKQLMEVVNNFFATIYKRKDRFQEKNDENHEDRDNGQLVKWVVQHRIKRFPTKLCMQTSVPYLFSHDFSKQIDIDFKANMFIIRNTKDDSIYMRIPEDLISTDIEQQGHRGEKVKLACSRICWYTESNDQRYRLRIINKANLDCIFEIENQENDKAPKLKLISAVKIDNVIENVEKLTSNHLVYDSRYYEPDSVLPRLIRMSQNYKIKLQHAITMQ